MTNQTQATQEFIRAGKVQELHTMRGYRLKQILNAKKLIGQYNRELTNIDKQLADLENQKRL